MQSTVTCLLESEMSFNVNTITENRRTFQKLETVQESTRRKLGYTLEKVNILNDQDVEQYYIEYANNLERYMKDQCISIEEAVENICLEYSLDPSDVVILLDESSIEKIDLPTLVESYNVQRI